MNPVWHELLANMAIVALFISIWSNIQLSEATYPPVVRQVVFGLILGVGVVVVMLLPFELEKGFFVDLRRTVISVAGLYGGPVSALITAGFAAVYRIHVGGAGVAAGLMGIASASLVGIATFYLLKGSRPGLLTILGFAATVAVTGTLGIFALPPETWWSVVTDMFLPAGAISFATTTMAAMAVSNELRRRKISRVNHIFRSAIECLPDPLSVRNLKGHLVIANPAAGNGIDFSADGGDRDFNAEEKAVLKSGQAEIVETRHVIENRERWFSTRLAPLRDRAGAVSGLITHRRDVTEQKLLETALGESQRRTTAALTNMADGLVMFDPDLNVVFCNEKYREMFPLTADLRVPGSSASSILYASIARGELVGIPPEAVIDWVKGAVSRLREAGTVQFALWDGRWIESRTSPAADGTCFVVCSDITMGKQNEQKLRALNDRLAELAETDGLTGLLNRRAFDAALQHELQRSGDEPLSLLLLDVDRFKAFNDTYGHISGDTCLTAIAGCLKSFASRGANRAARYGGEELALILPGSTEDEAIALAHELRQRIRALDIQHIASEKGIITASIGVATLSRRGGDADRGTLVKRADEALYAAKVAGRDLVRAWSPSKPQLIASGGARD